MSKHLYTVLIFLCFIVFAKESVSFPGPEKPEADTTISIDESLINNAHEAYENMAYKNAIELYEKLIDKNYLNANIYQKLADAYFKTKNSRKAEEYYKILVTSTIHRKEDVYDLVRVLKYNGKYKEAEKWLERYVKGRQDSSSVDESL